MAQGTSTSLQIHATNKRKQQLQYFFPILRWLPLYDRSKNFKFDLVAGITVAMMLIPQEISLSSIINVRPQHGLYTAALAPMIYAIFGSSTVLSVSSGSEVALLVGSVLAHIEDDHEREATAILICFFSGVILLTVRFLGLSQLADFFSRPVMGGFISAGGFLIMLSQVPNLLTIKIVHATYPPQTVYQLLEHLDKTEINGLLVGGISIIFLFALKFIKRRCFPSAALSDLFASEKKVMPQNPTEETELSSIPLNETKDIGFAYQMPLTPQGTSQGGPVPNVAADYINQNHYGFSLTDQQYLSMETERQKVLAEERGLDFVPLTRKLSVATTSAPRPKYVILITFIARTLCDLGPLLVCIGGGIAGYLIGPDNMKLTGHVPHGFPTPLVPWYGIQRDLIDEDKIGEIFVNALTIAAVVYLSSIAMSKRLAIQRGENINTDQELMGLGMASIVCGFFQANPPTGGMSRTAVNLQNAKTQLASIITVTVVITSLYTITGWLQYLPKATLASIIIVAGYSLVEIKEAKWLFRVKRDEFYVWLASFIATLLLGVLKGLIASIASSVIALMWKSKQSPIAILGQHESSRAFVNRDLFPHATTPIDGGIIAIRVESSLYFANCERVAEVVEQEVEIMVHDEVNPTAVVLDCFHMNDMDATTIQLFSDLQEKLAIRDIKFALANASAKLYDMVAATTLKERILNNDPRIKLEEAIEILQRPSTPVV